MTVNPPDRSNWTDDPLSASAPDAFGRGGFVETVVERIHNASALDPSTVFGLVGPWGSGKTSLLNRVRDGLADDWLVADFTPWSSGDSASMSFEFVTTLADLLDERVPGENRAKLAGYAGFIAPVLGAIPLVGDSARGAAEHALDALSQRPPWHKQFATLATAMKALNKRVLIVVDDVDRLGANELLTLLRIIRLLGRFHGVHYLIAYDQDTVEDLLRSTGSVGRSASFMEKIVQYAFETPPIPRAAVIRLLNDLIKDLLRHSNSQLDEVGLQRAATLVEALAPQITTPRSLGRLREHLLAFASHVKSAELDVLDYAGVTWLRLAAHGVWSALPAWHHELRTGSKAVGLLESERINLAEWMERVVQADAEADASGTMQVLSFLFEGVSVRDTPLHTPHSRAMSDPTYFGRYLLLAIPEDDISDELVAAVIEQADARLRNEQEAQLATLLDMGDDSVASLAISRLSALRQDAAEPNLHLFRFLADRLRARRSEDERLGAPRNGLRVMLAREMALAIASAQLSATEVIDLVGEKEALGLVWAAPRTLGFRERAQEIAAGFAVYWRERLESHLDELRDAGMLGAVVELIDYCLPADEIEGALDPAAKTYEDYIALARSFVDFNEWVGSAVSYELRFRFKPFAAVVSREVHVAHREQVLAEAGTVAYETDDHASREVGPEILRAFAVDSVAAIPAQPSEPPTDDLTSAPTI